VQTAVEPDLLIVDEALAVGDARFQKKCFDRLDALRSKGTTVLLVTHDTNTVVQICSRAVILEAGQALEDGKPQSVARSYHRLLFEGSQPEAEPAKVSQEQGEVVEPSDAGATGRDAIGSGDAAMREPATEKTHLATRPATLDVREVRYGSREAEIIEIGIRDPKGKRTSLIEAHDEYDFYFIVTFHRSIDNPVAYGFMISTPKGVEVFATKAALHGLQIPPSTAGTAYECRYRCRVPLVPGTYFLSVSLAHDDGREAGEFLDYRFDALQFEVTGATRCFTTCLIDLPGVLMHDCLGSSDSHSATKVVIG
jgi:lipopolysaccharide transport system ATP-binding protein